MSSGAKDDGIIDLKNYQPYINQYAILINFYREDRIHLVENHHKIILPSTDFKEKERDIKAKINSIIESGLNIDSIKKIITTIEPGVNPNLSKYMAKTCGEGAARKIGSEDNTPYLVYFLNIRYGPSNDKLIVNEVIKSLYEKNDINGLIDCLKLLIMYGANFNECDGPEINFTEEYNKTLQNQKHDVSKLIVKYTGTYLEKNPENHGDNVLLCFLRLVNKKPGNDAKILEIYKLFLDNCVDCKFVNWISGEYPLSIAKGVIFKELIEKLQDGLNVYNTRLGNKQTSDIIVDNKPYIDMILKRFEDNDNKANDKKINDNSFHLWCSNFMNQISLSLRRKYIQPFLEAQSETSASGILKSDLRKQEIDDNTGDFMNASTKYNVMDGFLDVDVRPIIDKYGDILEHINEAAVKGERLKFVQAFNNANELGMSEYFDNEITKHAPTKPTGDWREIFELVNIKLNLSKGNFFGTKDNPNVVETQVLTPPPTKETLEQDMRDGFVIFNEERKARLKDTYGEISTLNEWAKMGDRRKPYIEKAKAKKTPTGLFANIKKTFQGAKTKFVDLASFLDIALNSDTYSKDYEKSIFGGSAKIKKNNHKKTKKMSGGLPQKQRQGFFSSTQVEVDPLYEIKGHWKTVGQPEIIAHIINAFNLSARGEYVASIAYALSYIELLRLIDTIVKEKGLVNDVLSKETFNKVTIITATILTASRNVIDGLTIGFDAGIPTERENTGEQLGKGGGQYGGQVTPDDIKKILNDTFNSQLSDNDRKNAEKSKELFSKYFEELIKGDKIKKAFEAATKKPATKEENDAIILTKAESLFKTEKKALLNKDKKKYTEEQIVSAVNSLWEKAVGNTKKKYIDMALGIESEEQKKNAKESEEKNKKEWDEAIGALLVDTSAGTATALDNAFRSMLTNTQIAIEIADDMEEIFSQETILDFVDLQGKSGMVKFLSIIGDCVNDKDHQKAYNNLSDAVFPTYVMDWQSGQHNTKVIDAYDHTTIYSYIYVKVSDENTKLSLLLPCPYRPIDFIYKIRTKMLTFNWGGDKYFEDFEFMFGYIDADVLFDKLWELKVINSELLEISNSDLSDELKNTEDSKYKTFNTRPILSKIFGTKPYYTNVFIDEIFAKDKENEYKIACKEKLRTLFLKAVKTSYTLTQLYTIPENRKFVQAKFDELLQNKDSETAKPFFSSPKFSPLADRDYNTDSIAYENDLRDLSIQNTYWITYKAFSEIGYYRNGTTIAASGIVTAIIFYILYSFNIISTIFRWIAMPFIAIGKWADSIIPFSTWISKFFFGKSAEGLVRDTISVEKELAIFEAIGFGTSAASQQVFLEGFKITPEENNVFDHRKDEFELYGYYDRALNRRWDVGYSNDNINLDNLKKMIKEIPTNKVEDVFNKLIEKAENALKIPMVVKGSIILDDPSIPIRKDAIEKIIKFYKDGKGYALAQSKAVKAFGVAFSDAKAAQDYAERVRNYLKWGSAILVVGVVVTVSLTGVGAIGVIMATAASATPVAVTGGAALAASVATTCYSALLSTILTLSASWMMIIGVIIIWLNTYIYGIMKIQSKYCSRIDRKYSSVYLKKKYTPWSAFTGFLKFIGRFIIQKGIGQLRMCWSVGLATVQASTCVWATRHQLFAGLKSDTETNTDDVKLVKNKRRGRKPAANVARQKESIAMLGDALTFITSAVKPKSVEKKGGKKISKRRRLLKRNKLTKRLKKH
uniref:Uncharacterized protein n=1 Tax=viral metagenome TaxID=1070528 RepID=A0A6C0LBN4_9ZZZZ